MRYLPYQLVSRISESSTVRFDVLKFELFELLSWGWRVVPRRNSQHLALSWGRCVVVPCYVDRWIDRKIGRYIDRQRQVDIYTYSLQNLLFFGVTEKTRFKKKNRFFRIHGFQRRWSHEWCSWRCSKVNTLRAFHLPIHQTQESSNVVFHFKNAESVFHMCSLCT